MKREAREAWRRIRQEKAQMDALHWEALQMDAARNLARVHPNDVTGQTREVNRLRATGLRGLALVAALASVGPPVVSPETMRSAALKRRGR